MLDNQLFKLIISTLSAGMTTIGQGAIEIQQDYQPTQQGVPTDPTIFLYKVGPDVRVGQPERTTATGAGAAVFTGAIVGSVLTVSGVTGGALEPNQAIAGAGITAALVILSQIDGETGGIGTYQLNQANPTIAAESMTSQGTFVSTESTQYTSTFQASALATQDPANTDSLTASDILNFAAAVLQSQSAIDSFEAQGCGILRITQLRNPYFSDDRQRYEASPSFDFTITHHQVIITTTRPIDGYELQVLDV